MTELRLQSLPAHEGAGDDGRLFVGMGVHTPGLIAWAKASRSCRNPRLVQGLAQSFGLKPEVILALLTGEVEYRVEGDEVVFNWPGNDPFVKEVK